MFAVLDGPVVPAWVERILLELVGSEVVEWAGVAARVTRSSRADASTGASGSSAAPKTRWSRRA